MSVTTNSRLPHHPHTLCICFVSASILTLRPAYTHASHSSSPVLDPGHARHKSGFEQSWEPEELGRSSFAPVLLVQALGVVHSSPPYFLLHPWLPHSPSPHKLLLPHPSPFGSRLPSGTAHHILLNDGTRRYQSVYIEPRISKPPKPRG